MPWFPARCLPADPALWRLCQDFVGAPRIGVRSAEWAALLHVGERTLHRRFRAETGLALAPWRRRACVLHALPLLSAGTPVAEVAAALGCAGPGAFTTVFHGLLGVPPSEFRER